MGLFDMFGSKPPPQKGGLLATQPAQPTQPADPSLRDKWILHKQDAMEQGTKALTWEQFQAQQKVAPK